MSRILPRTTRLTLYRPSFADDPEFPRLKASYRDFLTGTSRFREAVEIKDPSIQMKIHQTYRLAYLKDVVLARILEDSTTNMLNSLIYFNQNDIVQHMQANTELLIDVFAAFQPAATLTAPLPRPAGEGIHFVSDRATTEESEVPPPPPPSAMPSSVVDSPELEAHKKDVVLLLHQLLIMSKNIALTSRLHLVRTLLEHGLVHVLEWAFSTCTAHATTTLPPSLSSSSSSFSLHPPPPSPPPLDDQIPNAAVEMLTHALDHDLQAVRSIVLKEHEAIQSAGEELSEEGGGADAAGGDGAGNHGTTLVVEMIRLLVGKEGGPSRAPPGLRSQLADALKQLLDTGDPDATSTFTRGPVKDGPIAESFISYFYDHCVLSLMKPLLDLPEFKTLKGTCSPSRSVFDRLLILIGFRHRSNSRALPDRVLPPPLPLRPPLLLLRQPRPPIPVLHPLWDAQHQDRLASPRSGQAASAW